MIAAVLLALAPLASTQGDGDERSFDGLLPGTEIEAVERPKIFLRSPLELPRAAPGAWDSLSDPVTRDDRLRELDAAMIQKVAEAERAYLQDRFPQALEKLYDVLTTHADFPPALMLLGTTYFRLRRYDDCRIALERFLEVLPVDLWRTQALGHAYYSLGDYERARAHYQAVIAAIPPEMGESPEAIRGLALCHMRDGDPDGALALLDHVIELRPEHAEAWTFKARILFGEDRLEEALEAADKARELAPFAPQAWYFAMRILYDLGRPDEAKETEARWRELDRVAQEVRGLEMQLRFRPGSFGILARLSELAASVGDIETARGRLADLVLARPENVSEAQVRIFVLDTLIHLRDADGARVAALALEETCPNSLEAWKRLELYYASQRDRVNQVRCASQVARLESATGSGG